MKNPHLNALAASAYIVLITFLFHALQRPNTPDTALDSYFAPILMLSLFTFSAALMGYLFAFEPIKKYIDGDKMGAVRFFGKTLGSFAVLTLVFLIAYFVLR